MNQFDQINRLVKKGLFDERLKEQKRKNKKRKKLKIACGIVSILITLCLAGFVYQLMSASSTETSSDEKSQTINKKNDKLLKPFFGIKTIKKTQLPTNILMLGRPGQGYPGQDLTDTIIIVHLAPTEKKAILISLPRDLLIKAPNTEQQIKINSLCNLAGIEALKEKITNITGLAIDRHILVDLTIVKEIIALVDGLNVYVPQDINDPFFPGPNHSYQAFILKAGWRYLNDETALKYIRTRYTSPNGDFDRMARQQQIIQLLKKKVLALNPLWDLPTYLKVFNALNDHIETDLGLLEIKKLWQTTKDIGVDQIISVVIDKKETNLLISGQIMFREQPASVVWPKAGQGEYNEIRKFIQNIIK